MEVPAGCTSDSCQTTVASGLASPLALTVDATGNLFITDIVNNNLVKLQRSQPPALSFAATNVNSTSSDSPQTVTIQNIGNQPLNAISPGLGLTGTNTSSFALGTATGNCAGTFSLGPGVSCDLSISFTPVVSGLNQSALVLTDNALNANPAQQTITLNGTGVALPQTITFNLIPAQTQGTAITLTAKASSGLPVTFTSLTTGVCTVSGTTATLVSAGTCTIQASQVGNSVYAAASPVRQSFTVLPGFTITSNPPSETVYRGQIAAFILTLKSLGGFKGSVNLSCSGGPAGSYCANFPMTVYLNGTAYAVSGIFFPQKTAPGTYTITFNGVSGFSKSTATATFTVK